MFDFGNNGVPRDEYTDATVRYIEVDADRGRKLGCFRKAAGRR